MKKIIIVLVVISLFGCKKTNSVNRQGEGVAWNITQAQVLYYKTVPIKYESGIEYQYTSLNNWYKVGTYEFVNDSIFSHTSVTGYTYKALYQFSKTGDTLIFRDVHYKFDYPTGGEPKDILVKQ